jgi:hypothetical protein
VTAELRAAYAVDNTPDSAKNTIFFGSSPPFDETLKPDAEFTERLDLAYATFTFAGTDKELESLSSAGFMLAAMTDADTMPPFYGASDDLFRGDKSVSGSHFSSANEVVADGWDRKVFIGGGGQRPAAYPLTSHSRPGYAAVIYLNGERRETLILKAVSGGE